MEKWNRYLYFAIVTLRDFIGRFYASSTIRLEFKTIFLKYSELEKNILSILTKEHWYNDNSILKKKTNKYKI